jgi:Lon protease-like protein
LGTHAIVVSGLGRFNDRGEPEVEFGRCAGWAPYLHPREAMSGKPLLPEDFSGHARLFPLPDLVLFPHVVQPLRVFEPRYVALLEDALQGDKLITMALLQPGWEGRYEDDPPIHPVVCVGRVMLPSRLTDGTYNLLLGGVARGRIRREQARERLYREAEVELLADQEDAESDEAADVLKVRLLRAFWQFHPDLLADDPSIEQLLQDDEVPLGMLADVMAFAAPLELLGKQQLLAEPSVTRRVERLIEQLGQLRPGTSPPGTAHPRSRFPLDFSDN